MTLLSVKDLHVSVDGKQILNGINLEIGEGEIHAIMGPNGSGKALCLMFFRVARATLLQRVKFYSRARMCSKWSLTSELGLVSI